MLSSVVMNFVLVTYSNASQLTYSLINNDGLLLVPTKKILAFGFPKFLD